MISFQSDYNNGMLPEILEALGKTNDDKTPGYGFDPYTAAAKEKIRKAVGNDKADVYLLTGGTQTDSKLAPQTLSAYMDTFLADESHPHMVQPGMVYVSMPTEFGMVYTKNELENLYATCQKHNLLLFIDGARLGYGLMSEACDYDLPFLAAHCDVFYIGGTKVGAMMGEAVVFSNMKAPKYFFTNVKRHGALLAKGRMLGLQFDTLFTDGRYFKVAQHAINMAARIGTIFKKHGVEIAYDSPTNQQFVILSPSLYDALSKEVAFEIWERKSEEEIICRFVTSWATREAELDELDKVLGALVKA